MQKSIMRKIPFHKKLLRFLNLDIRDQTLILLRFYIPLLIGGGILQYCCPEYDYNLMGIITWIFILLVVILSLPEDNVEIISSRDQAIRAGKMLLNIILGIVYFGVAITGGVKLGEYIGKHLMFDVDVFWGFIIGYAVIYFALIVWLILWKFKGKLFFKLPESIVKGVHIFNVENTDFLQMESNNKKIEFRLADNKRMRIKVGDILLFNNIDNLDKFMYAEVTKLYYAENFAELLSQIDIRNTGNNKAESVLHSLNQQYTEKQQKKRKVIGIEFEKTMNQ